MPKTNTPIEREFFDAVTSGQIVSVRKMVNEAPELLSAFDYDYYGATPFTRVCSSGHQEMLELLIELGADVNRRSDWEMGPWSPLHCAIAENNSELAKFFLDHGAILDAHTSAALGQVDELRNLLNENPQRITEPGGDGCHPLHFAGTHETAELLLKHGADINARCLDHFSTPIQYMATARPDMAKYLISQGAEIDIFVAALLNLNDQLQQMVEENPEVLNERIDQKRFPPPAGHDVYNILTFTIGLNASPLHAAAKGNSVDAIDLLISSGMDPNQRGGYDDATGLHIAAWENHVEAIEQLLAKGADVNLRSGEMHNNSPAGWAIVAGSSDAFSLLLDKGGEVLDFFEKDAAAGVEGQFCGYRPVPMSQRQNILNRLQQQSTH